MKLGQKAAKTFKERLLAVMKERGLKQTDVVALAQPYCAQYGVKLNKSDLSQYLSEKVIPGDDKVIVIGRALQINPSWLMGYDSPKEIGARPVPTPGQPIPHYISDKGTRLSIRIGSSLYDDLVAAAEANDRSLEDEVEERLFWSIEEDIENALAQEPADIIR